MARRETANCFCKGLDRIVEVSSKRPEAMTTGHARVVASAKIDQNRLQRSSRVMTAKKQKSESEDNKALRLAETTDVSPKQAKELMRKHGKDSPKVEKEARN